MLHYDSNVTIVMNFLNAERYSRPEISIHRRCYNEFRKYLEGCGCEYSKAKSDEWQKINKEKWTGWRIKKNRVCLSQLNDVFEFGFPRKIHTPARSVWHGQLSDRLSRELDFYMANFDSSDDIYRKTIRMQCADFLLFIQSRAKNSIIEVDYDDALAYFYHDADRNESTKRRYVSNARRLLEFYANQRLQRISISLVMDRCLTHQLITLGSFSPADAETIMQLMQSSLDFPADEVWASIAEFIKVMDEHRYSKTSIKSARHVLTLLFIFLEMHGIGYLPEIAQIWFTYEKPLFQTAWKSARKILRQFEEFTAEGNICPGKHDFYSPRQLDSLPVWCRRPLEAFLELKEREHKKKSTVNMYRASNIRFCRFLLGEGVGSFNEVTAGHLTHFNLDDQHSTSEGKNAYNVRIRNFLIYLGEQGIIGNCLLHRALPCTFAPRERVVQTLCRTEVEEIESYRENAADAYALRHSAMILLGLKMGLRASDIVNLKFANIDWKAKTVSLIQQKTLTAVLLPMPTTVGNAIFKYITKGRPSIKSSYVFIHHKVPYGRLTPGVCRIALEKAVPNRSASGSGFHVTRRTFASSMLKGGAKVNTIIDSLGQRSDSTVHRYLSLDEERMLMCPLSLRDVGILLTGGGPLC